MYINNWIGHKSIMTNKRMLSDRPFNLRESSLRSPFQWQTQKVLIKKYAIDSIQINNTFRYLNTDNCRNIIS